jgi:hypothetical protein
MRPTLEAVAVAAVHQVRARREQLALPASGVPVHFT